MRVSGTRLGSSAVIWGAVVAHQSSWKVQVARHVRRAMSWRLHLLLLLVNLANRLLHPIRW